MSAVGIGYLLAEFRDRIAAFEGVSLTVADRVGSVARANTPRAHHSARVVFARSDNRDEYRDRDLARVDTLLRVELEFRINAGDQTGSEEDALRAAELLRVWLTDTIWLRAYHPTFVSLAAAASPDPAFYRLDLSIRVTHDARLGG